VPRFVHFAIRSLADFLQFLVTFHYYCWGRPLLEPRSQRRRGRLTLRPCVLWTKTLYSQTSSSLQDSWSFSSEARMSKKAQRLAISWKENKLCKASIEHCTDREWEKELGTIYR
jgi:hypothetical protein